MASKSFRESFKPFYYFLFEVCNEADIVSGNFAVVTLFIVVLRLIGMMVSSVAVTVNGVGAEVLSSN